MRNIYLSDKKSDLYLLIGNDPNEGEISLIRIKGADNEVSTFLFEVVDRALKVVFRKVYSNLKLDESFMLEFFPNLPKGEYLLNLKINEKHQSLNFNFI